MKFHYPALFVTLLGATPVMTQAEAIHCPALIQELASISDLDASWRIVSTQRERSLERVGLYLGDPAEQGSLLPDATYKSETVETVLWRLPPTTTDAYRVGHVCQHDRNSRQSALPGSPRMHGVLFSIANRSSAESAKTDLPLTLTPSHQIPSLTREELPLPCPTISRS